MSEDGSAPEQQKNWPPKLSLPPTPIPDFMKGKNQELEILYLTLRRADQKVLDELFKRVEQHHAAMQKAERLLPIESLLLMMALEQRKWLEQEVMRLAGELERLSAQIEALKGKPD
jgi:hypothetical protein